MCCSEAVVCSVTEAASPCLSHCQCSTDEKQNRGQPQAAGRARRLGPENPSLSLVWRIESFGGCGFLKDSTCAGIFVMKLTIVARI